MTGPEMLDLIQKRERKFIREPENYYARKNNESWELQRLFWRIAVPIMVIIGCLCSLSQSLYALYSAFEI